MPKVALRAALSAALLCAGAAAGAQTGASVALVSDYRYRGVSLSDERPTLRLDVTHDASDGWYAGGSLARVALDSARWQAQWLGYLGHSFQLSERLGWDLGLSAVHFGRESQFDYGEWFTGVQGDHWAWRLHYAPDYFGAGARTVYGEFSAALPLARFTRVLFHAGVLARVGTVRGDAERARLDASLGLATTCGVWEWQLDLTAASRSGNYLAAYGRERERGSGSGTLVLSVSHPY